MRWRLANAAAAGAITAAVWLGATRCPGLGGASGQTWTVAWGGAPPWWSLPQSELFGAAALFFGLVYGLWYLAGPDRCGRPLAFWIGLGRLLRRPLDPGLSGTEREALLSVAVKAFFLPLMVRFSAENLQHLATAAGNSAGTFTSLGFPCWYVLHAHWAILNAMILVDTAVFTFGYAVEHRRLGNQVRSVEPTLLGWLVVLICYPPFNTLGGDLLGWSAADLPNAVVLFGDRPWAWWLTTGLGLAVNALFLCYVYASLALGLRAGNLVNRGTVERGPYAWVRHPAYASKNLAWLLASLLVAASRLVAGDWVGGLVALLSWLAWAFVYHLRALTEERHLAGDPEYRDYCQRVRWRYLPGLW